MLVLLPDRLGEPVIFIDLYKSFNEIHRLNNSFIIKTRKVLPRKKARFDDLEDPDLQ